MKKLEYLLHLLTPRHTNNHRPKILHVSGLVACITLLITLQFGLSLVHTISPEVLGYASNINVGDLLSETNTRRSGAGVGPLSLNDQLNNAAAGKASDMFANQYWAHNSPAGKEPWVFITGAGYNYVFAGENLARDFGDSRSVVDAWMNSPSHRENLLNDRFKDVGFAIQNGKYGDSETTLVVQMFGAQAGASQAIAAATPPPVNAPTPQPSEIPSPTLTLSETPSPTSSLSAAPISLVEKPPPKSGAVLPEESPVIQPKFDILTLTKQTAFALTAFLLGVLALDSFLVYRRKTVRLSGHNLAHAMMLILVLTAINLLGRGVIL